MIERWRAALEASRLDVEAKAGLIQVWERFGDALGRVSVSQRAMGEVVGQREGIMRAWLHAAQGAGLLVRVERRRRVASKLGPLEKGYAATHSEIWGIPARYLEAGQGDG